MIKCLLTELQSMTLELGSIEGITLTCCARPLFPFPPNVVLELGHGPPKNHFRTTLEETKTGIRAM